MKIINLVFAALFTLFALVQLNDPDPWGWTAFYVFMAAVCGFAAFGKYHKWVLLGGIAICVIWALTILPQFINWLQMGMPTITGQMKATEPHIEFTREFLGLLISGLILFWLYRHFTNKPVKTIV